MEEEKVVDKIQAKSSTPLPTGIPINWGLITGPVPEPVFPAPSLSTQLPPPQSSAVHALQTKVKSLTQRRTRGKDREKEREKFETEVLVSSPTGQISSEVLLRQRPRGKGLVSLPALSWRSSAAKNLSSSDEEEEVEVQVSFQIHSPPAEARGQKGFEEGEEAEDERSERNEDQVSFLTGQLCGLGEGTSLESLLSDNSSSSKDDPSPPPPLPSLSSIPASTAITTSSISSSTSSTSTRHWAPPKGFWRVARPETLLLNGVGPNTTPSTLPLKDHTQTEALAEPQRKSKPAERSTRSDVGIVVDDSEASSEFKHSDSVECYLDRCEQKELDADLAKGLCSSDSWESISSQSDALTFDEKLKVKQRAYAKLRERQQNCREEKEQSGGESAGYYGDTTCRVDCEVPGAHAVSRSSDSAILAQELEPYLRSLLVISDEHPLSPRHEQAKLLLERARLKARSNHIKGDRPCRRSHSDQRPTVKKQQVECTDSMPVQKAVQTKEDHAAQTVSGPLLVPNQGDTSPGDQGGRSRRYGCSPTRVRFEDESEKEAESRYLDRVRQRSRSGLPKSKNKESNTDSSSSGSERSRSHRSVSMPPLQKKEVGVGGQPTTVIKEIIVLVKKCEACGSVVREPQPVSSPPEQQNTEPPQPEDPRVNAAPRWVSHNKPEASTRPKAPLTVTFAGAFVLGENKESGTGWKSSGFGKLRRRSRKGESRLESGHGPYGPSWAQRRNSNPRNRLNLSRAVSFAPDSPVALEPHLLDASDGLRESPAPSLPIKSALKSSSRNRSAAGQPTVQFQVTSNQGGEGGSQHSALLDSPEARRECAMAVAQGTLATSNAVPYIRPSTLRYSPPRLTTDLPVVDVWDATPDGTGLSDLGSGPDCRPALRGLAMARTEDLRAELLRAEHLKAEALWEENSDGSRKLDGRPKLFLRRFFSSIGLNSVGRLVKGGRSSSMEQLSIPAAPRVCSASPSPTRRPLQRTADHRMQRTPSLQTLHTVLPLAQLRKASSVQSLERRTERSTILGEVQIPYGLAPSPDSPQLELHRDLSVEDILASRIARPVGRVTHAFPDGTLLLELVRPPNGPFGFVISRGKGRPDTGVYVEKVGDGGGEGPYIGLLSIGDEILQVNGEAVAGLSLDHVTRLMTRESTASLRIIPARRSQR
ncbi:uncharacterized protein si:ch211-13f8.1 isoform X2 [Etheostoma spectabile]|uniref:uncharacterized protein si:ch211-13f8.1 isoform X2 n=1 Tax=Etheostoma spectabile TaxID=54343 RepID=UPI0013AEB5B1|nr:uncharacterized protein KIAA1614 homolog isoform X2 [Etheostoma spectabile]